MYISVLGQEGSEITLNKTTLQGAILGLGVAFSLAMNFTIIRKDKDVPFVLAIALGAFMAAALGAVCADALYWPPLGNMAAIALTGDCYIAGVFRHPVLRSAVCLLIHRQPHHAVGNCARTALDLVGHRGGPDQ